MKPTYDVELSHSQESIFQDFLKVIREENLLREGDGVLVAVSGGLDSSVLAYLFAKAARILRIKVHLAHVDHRTRGLASAQEAEWVKGLGVKLNLPVHSLVVPEGIASNQNEFRRHRRRLLLELAKVLGAERIATAHHADDNAETFLMRAISGTGVQGLRGMSIQDGLWIKPLIRYPKKDLLEFARAEHLTWVEDPSNSRGQYLRNRIRNEFFPMLEQIRRSSVSNLSLAAQRLCEEEEEMALWLASELEHQAPRMLPLGWLERWPKPIQRRVFRVWLTKNQVEPQPTLIEELLEGREIVHSQGVILKHSDHWVFFPEQDFGHKWAHALPLELSRRTFLGSSLAWSFLPKAPAKMKVLDLSVYLCLRVPMKADDPNFCLNWELMPKDLILRALRADDAKEAHERLSVIEMPKPFKRNWPVLSSRSRLNEVFAIVGVGVLEPYRYAHRGPCLNFECFFEESLVT